MTCKNCKKEMKECYFQEQNGKQVLKEPSSNPKKEDALTRFYQCQKCYGEA